MDEKKVKLDSIISGEGIVVRWPKKKEEKLAVLDYLITKFEPGVEYKEMQVNMILKKWHSFGDHALLRRELYDNFYMDRNPEKGVYWVEKNGKGEDSGVQFGGWKYCVLSELLKRVILRIVRVI